MPSDVPDRAAQPVAARRVRAALAAAADLGMFFGLADAAGGRGGWQPAGLLYAGDDGQLDLILESVRVQLGGCEPRVAASLFFQGYAARLLSPQLGCLVAGGCVPDLPAAALHWRRSGAAMIELGMTAGPGWQGAADALVARIIAVAFDEHLDPLASAVRARMPVAENVLRDNAASALVAGLRLLSGRLGPGWRALAAQALAGPYLRGCGSLHDADPAFVRRSCCLYYRVAGGGMCGDCPLPEL